METPRTFGDLMLADMRRAQNLVTKVHPNPIDPQFRIATPDGDYGIAIMLTENAKERARRLSLVSDFMAWKLSPGFTLASELHEPESVYVAGIMHREQHGLLSLTQRLPPNRAGTYEVVFTEPRWLTRENLATRSPPCCRAAPASSPRRAKRNCTTGSAPTAISRRSYSCRTAISRGNEMIAKRLRWGSLGPQKNAVERAIR